MRISQTTAIITFGLAAATAAGGFATAAPKLQTLYKFCTQDNCADGGFPTKGFVADAAGNLYGTTTFGGAHDNGTIFELRKQDTKYTYKVLYDFAACDHDTCFDGKGPSSALIIDTAGNLYGTMDQGGEHYSFDSGLAGVIYKLTPGAHNPMHHLYDFCVASDCSDGSNPDSALTYAGAASGALYDGTSPITGTTRNGGHWGQGMVYRITPGANPGAVLAFCSPKNCKSGRSPSGAISLDSDGTVYGANVFGKDSEAADGLVWSTKGSAAAVLHDFTCKQVDACKFGNGLDLGIMFDPANRNIFGTTILGGKYSSGTVFQLSLNGAFGVLHAFCKGSCKDGSTPTSTLYPAGDGTLLGTTKNGGNASNSGTLYRIDPATSDVSVLYAFCKQTNCPDGADPVDGVIKTGDTYAGVTFGGGFNNAGTVYAISP